MMQGILSQVISYIGTYIAQGEVNATLLHFSVNPINVAPLARNLEGLIPGNPTYFEFNRTRRHIHGRDVCHYDGISACDFL